MSQYHRHEPVSSAWANISRLFRSLLAQLNGRRLLAIRAVERGCQWTLNNNGNSKAHSVLRLTVYPKKYAHGFCFAVLCCGYTLTDFPISIRLTSLALWQSNDCPSASKATLMNMDKYFMWIHYERLHNHNKAKHNKTVCIFLGIYCTYFLVRNPPFLHAEYQVAINRYSRLLFTCEDRLCATLRVQKQSTKMTSQCQCPSFAWRHRSTLGTSQCYVRKDRPWCKRQNEHSMSRFVCSIRV